MCLLILHSSRPMILCGLISILVFKVGFHLAKWNKCPYVDGNYSKHLKRNSLKLGLGTTLLSNKVQRKPMLQ